MFIGVLLGAIFGFIGILEGMNGKEGLLVDIVMKPCIFYTQCMSQHLDQAFSGYKCVGCIVGGPIISLLHGCIIGVALGCLRVCFMKRKAA